MGCSAYLAQQVVVSERSGVAGLALEVEGHLLAVAVGHVAVDAVDGHVELAADEPLREGRVGPVEYVVKGGVPGQSAGLVGPEAEAVVLGRGVKRLVGVRLLGEGIRRGKQSELATEVFNGVVSHELIIVCFVGF